MNWLRRNADVLVAAGMFVVFSIILGMIAGWWNERVTE